MHFRLNSNYKTRIGFMRTFFITCLFSRIVFSF